MDSRLGPRLPWEVIERAIDHSRGHPNTLRSLALTCHQLLPRTRLVIFARVRFKNRDHVLAFIDFLEGNPHLMPVVRSIAVWPSDLAPFPLLRLLSNLCEIKFSPPITSAYSLDPERSLAKQWPELHQSTLTSFRLFGADIWTLHLSHLTFKTILSFARILVTFIHLTHLIYDDVNIIQQAVEEPPNLSRIIKRWCLERKVSTVLTVDYGILITSSGQATSMGRLLLGSISSAPLAIERITLTFKNMGSSGDQGEPLAESLAKYQCDWSSLQSLTLQMPTNKDALRRLNIVKFLESFPECLLLTDVTLEWRLSGSQALHFVLLIFSSNGQCKGLDHALLRFPKPRVIFDWNTFLPANSTSFWLGELRKHLPMLSQRGTVTLHSQLKEGLPARHEESVKALATSPDSKWVATGSNDSTIILWNTDNGTIAQRWLAHGYKGVKTLAFSPDSQCLVSGGNDYKAVVWNLNHGVPIKSTTLNSEANPHDFNPVTDCAWSPDGNTIATGSRYGATQLWDAHSFKQRSLHKYEGMLFYLAFSPSGRWLVCMTDSNECYIVNVASGTLHMSLGNHSPGTSLSDNHSTRISSRFQREITTPTAAFHPGSMRLAIASPGRSPAINVIDINTGNTLLVLDGSGEESVSNVSFSPDGRLVLGVVSDICYIWDASTGSNLLQLKGKTRFPPRYEGYKECIVTATFSPCGKYIAYTSERGALSLWKTNDGSCLATLSAPDGHLQFSPDGKTLSSASGEISGNVMIQRMRDIIPPIETQDDHSLIRPFSTSVVDSALHSSPLSYDDAQLYSEAETYVEEPQTNAECKDISEQKLAQERPINRDEAGFSRLARLQPTGGVSIPWEQDSENESAGADSLTTGHERTGSKSAAHSRSGDLHSMALAVEPIVPDGIPTSSARLSDSSPTIMERRACTGGGRPPAQERMDSTGPVQALPTIEQENADCSDSPIASDERAGSAARSSSRVVDSTVLAVEPIVADDVRTSSARLSDASLTMVERGASTNRGRPPTHEAREHADDWTTTATAAKGAANANADEQPKSQTAGDEDLKSAEGPASARRAEPGDEDASSSSSPTTSHPRRDLSLSAPSRPSTPVVAQSGSASGLSASESVHTVVDDSDPQTRAASVPPATPLVDHEAWPSSSSDAQEMSKTAATGTANAEVAVQTPSQLIDENFEERAHAVAAADSESPLDSNRTGDPEDQVETSREAPSDSESFQDRRDRPETSNGAKKQNRWTKVPKAIAASCRHVARRVVHGVRKYCEKLKKLGASASTS